LQRLEPADTRQAQVEQDDFRFRGSDSLDCILTRAHRVHFVAEATQFARHDLAECGIVIDQPEGRGLHCSSFRRSSFGCPSLSCGPGSIAGITTSNVDPFPGVLSTRMLPPQLRTAFSDRNRPRPVPPWRRLKKGSKIFCRYSGAMPHPSSVTRTCTASPPSSTTTTLPPGFDAL